MPKLPVDFREATAEDWPFIADSYVRSSRAIMNMRDAGDKRDDAKSFFAERRQRLTMLNERGAQFLVAFDTEDPDHIIGWACGEQTTLHYVFVKKHYRGLAIGRRLLSVFFDIDGDFLLHHSTTTPHWETFVSKFPNDYIYTGFDS